MILKQGTDEQQGYAQLMNNISACTSIADIVRTTLGPLGMDKLIVDSNGIKIAGKRWASSLSY